MKKKIFEAVLFRGVGSISQLGIISYIGYVAGFAAVGKFSVAYASVFIVSQMMKPGLEYFILAKVKPESKSYNYSLVWCLFLKVVTPIFVILTFLGVSIAPFWAGVGVNEVIYILLSAYFISAMHLMAEVFKADGEMFWYALSKMAGINVVLLLYYVIKSAISDLSVEGIDLLLATLLVFLMAAVRFSIKKPKAIKIEKVELLFDREFINYSMAGLLLSVVTLGYPLILDYFIERNELGIVFSLQKFAAVLTILSSSIYTASTKSLISKRTEQRKFSREVIRYYVVVLFLCLLYCGVGIALISHFDVLIEVRNAIFYGGWLVFIPEIIIVLTGPTMHVINILNDHGSMRVMSLIQTISSILSAALLMIIYHFEVEVQYYNLYLVVIFPIIFAQLYSCNRMLSLMGVSK